MYKIRIEKQEPMNYTQNEVWHGFLNDKCVFAKAFKTTISDEKRTKYILNQIIKTIQK